MNPVFSNNGQLTTEGQALVEWIERTIEATPKEQINNLLPAMKRYFIFVTSLNSLTPAQFLEDYRNSYAATLWANMSYLQEQAQTQQAQSSTNAKLLAELEALKVVVARLSDSLTTPAASDEPAAGESDEVSDAEQPA
jgi:hypothetical protein